MCVCVCVMHLNLVVVQVPQLEGLHGAGREDQEDVP